MPQRRRPTQQASRSPSQRPTGAHSRDQEGSFSYHHNPSDKLSKEEQKCPPAVIDDPYRENFIGTWGMCVPGYEPLFLLTNFPMLFASWLLVMTGNLILGVACFIAGTMSFIFHLHQSINPPSSKVTAFWLKMDISAASVAGGLVVLGCLANQKLPYISTLMLLPVAGYCGESQEFRIRPTCDRCIYSSMHIHYSYTNISTQ